MRVSLARHDSLMRGIIEANSGHVFKTIGDAFCAAFANAENAVSAAIAAQLALHQEDWKDTPIRVRMALHTGWAELRDNDYFGPTLNRVARLLAIGHGGQTLASEATYLQVRSHLPEGAGLQDMGQHRLKDLQQPEHAWQITHPDLPGDFPALRSLNLLLHHLPGQCQ